MVSGEVGGVLAAQLVIGLGMTVLTLVLAGRRLW